MYIYFKKVKLQANLGMIYQDPHIVAFCFDTRGSRIDTSIGKTRECKWIAFPILDKETKQSHFNDVYWNYESYIES